MMKDLTNQYSDNQDFKSLDLEQKILSRSSAFKINGGKTQNEALEELKKRISDKETGIISMESNDKRARMIWRISSIAAGILLIFGLWQIIPGVSETRIVTARGSQTDYTLPDGSDVRLNSESRITFKKNSFGSERLVSFKGEAFFNVKKGGSFRIMTPNGDVKVLGTSFNVFSRNEIFKVSCSTGKVIVIVNNQSVVIEPGESAELTNGTLKSFHDPRFKYVTGWINGEFYFENTPLNLVFDEIERQFSVKFVGKERKNEFFTGSFTNKDLDTALEIVCIPMGLEYEIYQNGEISICNKK